MLCVDVERFFTIFYAVCLFTATEGSPHSTVRTSLDFFAEIVDSIWDSSYTGSVFGKRFIAS
jgi:hypothetical protein